MARFIVGIDLGTTNSAMTYVDLQKPLAPVQLFLIPQFISMGRVDQLPTLPSFCYLIPHEEWPAGSLKLAWKEETFSFVGQYAKIKGGQIPTRVIQSAKSWLCNSSANRREKILPIEAANPDCKLSPIEATSKYLLHLKEAWNTKIAKEDPSLELEAQDIILTVPASFDEVARELTVEAARLAGFSHLTLLEEPQAAFYSWIAQNENRWKDIFQAGNTILVCDVGGGTTDFSLILVEQKENDLTFQRKAVGDHLLLGGDNMDSGIAYYLERKLLEQDRPSLDSTQWRQLLGEACSAKEHLLDPNLPSDQSYTIVLQKSGSSVIKDSITVAISKKEIEDLLLNGFFGNYGIDEALDLQKSRGLKTMGLPYEDEPSITKHLAHFLKQANHLTQGIDYLLFNGGTMKPESFQQAVLNSLKRWFPQKNVQILEPSSLDLAVARGASYYGKVRKGMGVFIGGGIPRSYYIEVEVHTDQGPSTKALALLPRGAEEGDSFEPNQIFFVRPNQPVSFNILTSHVRLNDQKGDIIDSNEEEMQKLPPIHTILRFGRKQTESINEKIPVHLGVKLTPIGTLEIWLKSQKTDHRWALEFQLRTAEGQESDLKASKLRQDETFDTGHLKEAIDLIESCFKDSTIKPEILMEKLEECLGQERREWSSSILRGMWEPLLKNGSQRKKGTGYETRWWNLAGFFLRPGFGYPLDDFRIKDLWKIILSEMRQNRFQELFIQQLICYRRIAGGLSKGQQMQIGSELIGSLLNKQNNKIEIKNKSELYLYSEKIRALASFERLELSQKIRLGEAILQKILKGEGIPADFWSLGRIGARHLAYESIAAVIPKDICITWIEELLRAKTIEQESLIFVLGQLARKTEHREINVPDALIEKILTQFESSELKETIYMPRPTSVSEQERVFGDRLPSGLIMNQLS